jgi:hypothetical protein
MQQRSSTLIDLEKKFWQSMVDQKPDVALDLLCEPSMMVSAHGAMKFDHAAYRKMAEQGTQVVKSFELSDVEVVFPNDTTAVVSYRVRQGVSPRDKGGKTKFEDMQDSSTWVKTDTGWRCAIHTETPAPAATSH